MEFKATLEERVSKRTGNTYKCVVVKFTDDYEKIFLLKDYEIKYLELLLSKNK